MLTFIQRFKLHLLALLAPFVLLTACGGGGSTGTLLTNGAPGSITLSVGTSTLPVQSGSFVQPISPLYSTTVIAKAFLANGSPVPTGTPIQFMMDGGNTYSGALYPQPFETDDVTQPDGTIVKVPKAFWSYSVNAAAGQALMVFHAWDRPGTVTIRASFADPSSKNTIVATTQIVVGSAVSTGLPSTVSANLANGPIYVANQGMNDAGLIDIYVADPVGEPVGNPPAPNVKVELLNPEIGATLLGQGGATGTIVQTTTTSGKAQVSLRSGTIAGVAKLRITADGLDNNVENGIQTPIIADVTVSIEDGRIASLAFTGAFSQAIKANLKTIPLAPGESFYDGTYLRIVSAIAIDNLGNPVKNARIDFSLIDSPLVNFPAEGAGDFQIGGNNGDPSEGGNMFTASGAGFTGNGTRINDRLAIGANQQGAVANFEQGVNRDLIGSRIISQILDANRLLVSEPFSANGGVNAGASLPWVVGRAQYGVIGASAITDAQGIATTFLTYPAVRLNQRALLTARAGNSRSILMNAYYAGIQANSSLVASTTSVYAGKSTSVTMCAYDGIQTPMGNTAILVSGLAGGIKLDPAAPVTGSNGCATFNIDAVNYLGSDTISLVFTINGQGVPSATIDVKPQAVGDVIIGIGGPGSGSREITVTLVNTLGEPMKDRTVTVTGVGNDDRAPIGVVSNTSPATTGAMAIFNGVTPASLKTDSEGKVTFTANYTGNAPGNFNVPGTPPIPTDFSGDTYTLTFKVVGASGTSTATFPY
jgi:hypothetical protein